MLCILLPHFSLFKYIVASWIWCIPVIAAIPEREVRQSQVIDQLGQLTEILYHSKIGVCGYGA